MEDTWNVAEGDVGMSENDMDVDMDVAENECEVEGIVLREVDGEEWLFTP